MKIILVLLAMVCVAYADIPVFDSPVCIQADGKDIEFSRFADPCVTDWNGDGLKDLFIGYCYSTGKVKGYLNSGTNQSPVFTSAFRLGAGGKKISVAGHS